MARSHIDLIQEGAALQQRMSAVFHSIARDKEKPVDPEARELQSAVGFVPPVDVYEDDGNYVLGIEIPGMRQDELNIRLETGLLTIRGERRLERDTKVVSYARKERRGGAFYRAFPLPHTVDVERVQARYEAGVLRIRLERRANCESRQIMVEEGSGPGKPISFVSQGSRSVA
jgi:HSP20 family protein